MSSLIALIRADAVLDAPAVPQSWQRQVESNGWTSVYPLGKADGRFFSARLILRQAANPTRALFVCTGPAAMLDRLATAIAADALPWTKTWATLAALRTDAGQVATAIKAAWPDDRPRVLVSGEPGNPQDPPVYGAPIGPLVALRARMAGAAAEDAET